MRQAKFNGYREVEEMPFGSSYTDFDRHKYIDSRDYLIGIAKIIVREPLSTHIVKTAAPGGKIRYLVVDRSQIPGEGDMAVVRTDSGFKAGVVKRAVLAGNAWGKVIWFIQEG
ncbi:MAG: hypothetical protein LBS45_05305 [Synergistaceae bacterium]|jgi:hypothetical protein|nr:hypothetical protein [Synergistaceae bacterium]